MHSFTTERLLIRPIQAQDQALYISLYTDAKIMRHISAPLSLQAAEKAFNSTLNVMNKVISSAVNKAESNKKAKVMTWVIVTLDNQQSIGIQALHWQTDNCAEIGIMLLRQSNGRLLPEEAIGSVLEYGLHHLHLKQIKACYAKKNLATARVAKKAGFTFYASNQTDDERSKTDTVYSHSWHRQYIKTIIG